MTSKKAPNFPTSQHTILAPCRVWLEHMREWLEVLLACRSLRPLVDLSSSKRPEFKGPSLLLVLGGFVSSTDSKLQAAALRCLQVCQFPSILAAAMLLRIVQKSASCQSLLARHACRARCPLRGGRVP